MIDQFNYKRRISNELKIGNLLLGGNNPIRVQTMANTDTNDLTRSVEQTIRVIEAGSELMRFTTQGAREVESLHLIHSDLQKLGYAIPLVADIHFNASAAMLAAQYVEKVRINPGNFVASIKKKDDTTDYSNEEFQQEFEILKKQFVAFLDVCKKHKTVIRIGVNHGSLGRRIMDKYGDTARGMVESCMELLRICREENFNDVVISMKTSNTVFMVYAVRLLVVEMEKEDFAFPLHLGVTEAGDGEDGRIKSAVGIGALLSDGIGDTIRVSLSENPENEIPVAKKMVEYIGERENHQKITAVESSKSNYFEYERRKTHSVQNIGGNNVPVVIGAHEKEFSILPDYFYRGFHFYDNQQNIIRNYWQPNWEKIKNDDAPLIFALLTYAALTSEVLEILRKKNNIVILLYAESKNPVGEIRAFFHKMMNADCTNPVIICREYQEKNLTDLQIKASMDIGTLLIDGFGDGVFIENIGDEISFDAVNSIAFGILQAARVRITKTDYISCPGCGRTLFDLQKSIARVKEKTAHLTGLKIAIMGCIVNGPGEMADADYGYVGAGRGKVNLYKKKECVERNIPEEEAVERLIELINREEF